MVAMVQVPAAVPATADRDAVAPRSYLAEVRTRFFHNRAGMIALSALVLLAGAAMVAPLLSPYDPLMGNATRRLLPIGSAGHLLGTDEQGRDMLTRLLYGGRLSLLTGMLPVIVATVMGTAIGATAGYLRGPVGAVLMRTMDMLYAFPAIMLAIAISASLGPGVTNSVLAISVVSRVRDAFEVDLPLRNLFERPTLSALAEAIDALAWSANGAQQPGGAGAREEIAV